jgi:hypothetical protein
MPKTLDYDPVAATQKLRAAEEAEAAKHAEAAALVRFKQNAEELAAKAAADAKAKKIADAKAALAALEAEEGGFDDGPRVVTAEESRVLHRALLASSEVVSKGSPPTDTPAQTEEKKRTRRTRAEMEAVRAAEAAKASPAQVEYARAGAAGELPGPHATVIKAATASPSEAPTTASLGGPVEIPPALAAALPAWD